MKAESFEWLFDRDIWGKQSNLPAHLREYKIGRKSPIWTLINGLEMKELNWVFLIMKLSIPDNGCHVQVLILIIIMKVIVIFRKLAGEFVNYLWRVMSDRNVICGRWEDDNASSTLLYNTSVISITSLISCIVRNIENLDSTNKILEFRFVKENYLWSHRKHLHRECIHQHKFLMNLQTKWT